MDPKLSTHQFGVLAELPPNVLLIGAIWVCAADGIFAAMWLSSQFVSLPESVLAGLILFALLVLVNSSRVLSALASLATGMVYGGLIFSFSHITFFAVLVALQVGLMHYCAFQLLAKNRLRLALSRAGRAKPAPADSQVSAGAP
jgi:hypothetical protein